MHDIWNPWHGCTRCSEGCQNCYMYFLDEIHGNGDSSVVTRTGAFNYPVSKYRDGSYKIQSGELLRVCLTSDFFVEAADGWREEAWDLIHRRPDVKFWLLTKRPERVREHLPYDWGEGWENVMLSVSCENQRRADERTPVLLGLPFKHKGVMCAPLLGPVRLEAYLAGGQIEQVLCGGENYGGARPCDFDWVKSLRAECEAHGVTFAFLETGTEFIKDGRRYHIPDKTVQSEMAWKSGMGFQGRPIDWKLSDTMGVEIPESELYVPRYRARCECCGSRSICNGCSDCGKCDG